MLNPEMLLGQLLRGGLGRSRRRGRLGLLGGISGGSKAQIGMGLLGVAIAAYEHYTSQSQNQSSMSGASPQDPPTPSSSSQVPPPVPSMPRSSLKSSAPSHPAQGGSDAILLVQAMVAAAAADGEIDDTERAQILRRAEEAGFDQDTKDFLRKELESPKSLAVIVASARPELAADLYAASCAAITADTDAERAYLETLGKRLKLPAEVTEDIHQKLASI